MNVKGKLDNDAIEKLQIDGKMICEGCRGKISLNQYVYVVGEKFYHDCCSSNIKGRVKIL